MPHTPIDNVAALLPHSGNMVLLDTIHHYDAQSLHASARLRPGCILLPSGHNALPIWMGGEILAQGIGAWAGAHALDRGQPVRLGFLLGSRKLHCDVAAIPIGTELDIHIRLSLQDDTGMGVFDCTLSCRTPAPGHEAHMPPGTRLMHGAMNVFSPASDAILEQTLGRHPDTA
ncbi:MAG: thioester dehydrase [Cardiobacteriaceae bacterium]|nr:thioester dehydrase [Cardiobacteriaceae bacterium]